MTLALVIFNILSDLDLGVRIMPLRDSICYANPVGECSIVISVSVCLGLSGWMDWISPEPRHRFAQTACIGSVTQHITVPPVFLWWHCDVLCYTSGLVDDVTFGCIGPCSVFRHWVGV